MKSSQEASEFISISTAKGPERTSALFYHIMHNGVDAFYGAPVVKNIIKPTASRRAYLIDLVLHQNLHDLSTYMPKYILDKHQIIKLADRHISIFETFGTETSELAMKKLHSHWHYTERYNIGGGRWISVHVYFHYGLYLGTYIKEPSLPAVKVDDMAAKARANCMDAHELVLLAINTMKAKKENINNKFEVLAISLLKRDYLLNATDKKISEDLNKLKKLDDLLGNYQEDISPSYLKRRYNILAERIKSLRSQVGSTITKLSTSVSAEPSTKLEITNTVTTGIKLATKFSAPKTNSKPIDEIHKAFNVFKAEQRAATTAKQHIMIAAKIEELKDELLITYFNSQESDQITKRKCDIIEAGLKSLPTLFDIFVDFAHYYNHTQAIELFSHIRSDISPSFYIKFYLKLERNVTADTEQSAAKLVEFFYENSEDYRLLISSPRTMFSRFDLPDGDFVAISPLLPMAIKGRLNLFRTLITQFNTVDLQGALVDRRNILLIEALCLMSTSSTSDIAIKLLLNFEAIIENHFPFADGIECHLVSEKDDVKPAHLHGAIQPKNTVTNQDPDSIPDALLYKILFKDSPYLGSALSAYCMAKYCATSLLQRIALRTSDIHLLLSIARYTFKENVLMVLLYTNENYGVKSAAPAEQKNTIAADKVTHVGAVLGSLDPQRHACVEILVQELSSRMNKNSQAKIRSLVEMLQVTSDSYEQRNNAMNALACQKALLLLATCLNTSLENHQLILHTLLKCANIYLIEGGPQAQIYFQNAMQFATNSIYSAVLIVDSQYQAAMLKYNPDSLANGSNSSRLVPT